MLFDYAARNIGEKEECAEIVQDVFESLWRRRADIRIHSTLKGYLIGMVRHKIIGYFRKNRLKKKYAEHFLLFEAVYLNASQHDDTAVLSAMDKLVSELPDRCRHALKLRLSEDLSNREIAKRMNIGIRTVETYMLRAFNYIRTHYQEASE